MQQTANTIFWWVHSFPTGLKWFKPYNWSPCIHKTFLGRLCILFIFLSNISSSSSNKCEYIYSVIVIMGYLLFIFFHLKQCKHFFMIPCSFCNYYLNGYNSLFKCTLFLSYYWAFLLFVSNNNAAINISLTLSLCLCLLSLSHFWR